MVLQMEASVHVVNTAGDLINVCDDSEEERSGVGDNGLPNVTHTQGVTTEPVSAVMSLIILTVTARQEEVVRTTGLSTLGSINNWILEVLVKICGVGKCE